MSEATYLIGDVFDRLAGIPDGTVDLVLTSPPFLALRSYLPADHPDKGKEIGSEPTPAEFLDTLLALTAEWRRVLAPHGSIAVELGDTYAGSGGAGGDYNPGGLRDGQEKFDGSSKWDRSSGRRAPGGQPYTDMFKGGGPGGSGWPMDKSLCGIPHLYHLSLAYGRNLLTGADSPAGQWRVRNVVAWVRPNPPVGALGDKFRPATSYMTVATVARDRYFDLDAVRTPSPWAEHHTKYRQDRYADTRKYETGQAAVNGVQNPAGAPPLDWWEIPTQPYKGRTTTTRRERVPSERASACGAERTTSPDCPVHAGLPGQLPRALRDAHAAEMSPRTQRSSDHHALELPLDSGTSGSTPGRSDSVPSPTSAPAAPGCSPAATTRSTSDRRTAPAPATSPAGTPSARTAGSTGDTSTSPESSEPHPGTPGNRSAEACPPADEPGTPSRTADTSSPSSACTCSWYRTVTESTSHYATWPAALCVRPILAMTPQRVCTTCGQPSRRITEASYEAHSPNTIEQQHAMARGQAASGTSILGVDSSFKHGRATKHVETVGWSTCGHNTWRPGHVLDPFAGSGTTLAVATGHGRDATGIDLDPRNADLARDRIGMFLNVDTPAVPEAS